MSHKLKQIIRNKWRQLGKKPLRSGSAAHAVVEHARTTSTPQQRRELTENERRKVREIFESHPTPKTKEQIQQLMHQTGEGVSESTLTTLLKLIEWKEGTYLNTSQFEQLMEHMKYTFMTEHVHPDSDTRDAFIAVANYEATIPATLLAEITAEFGLTINTEEMLREINKRPSDKLTYKDFAAVFGNAAIAQAADRADQEFVFGGRPKSGTGNSFLQSILKKSRDLAATEQRTSTSTSVEKKRDNPDSDDPEDGKSNSQNEGATVSTRLYKSQNTMKSSANLHAYLNTKVHDRLYPHNTAPQHKMSVLQQNLQFATQQKDEMTQDGKRLSVVKRPSVVQRPLSAQRPDSAFGVMLREGTQSAATLGEVWKNAAAKKKGAMNVVHAMNAFRQQTNQQSTHSAPLYLPSRQPSTVSPSYPDLLDASSGSLDDDGILYSYHASEEYPHPPPAHQLKEYPTWQAVPMTELDWLKAEATVANDDDEETVPTTPLNKGQEHTNNFVDSFQPDEQGTMHNSHEIRLPPRLPGMLENDERVGTPEGLITPRSVATPTKANNYNRNNMLTTDEVELINRRLLNPALHSADFGDNFFLQGSKVQHKTEEQRAQLKAASLELASYIYDTPQLLHNQPAPVHAHNTTLPKKIGNTRLEPRNLDGRQQQVRKTTRHHYAASTPVASLVNDTNFDQADEERSRTHYFELRHNKKHDSRLMHWPQQQPAADQQTEAPPSPAGGSDADTQPDTAGNSNANKFTSRRSVFGKKDRHKLCKRTPIMAN